MPRALSYSDPSALLLLPTGRPNGVQAMFNYITDLEFVECDSALTTTISAVRPRPRARPRRRIIAQDTPRTCQPSVLHASRRPSAARFGRVPAGSSSHVQARLKRVLEYL